MTNIRLPRPYWASTSDDELVAARNEYLTLGADFDWTQELVAEIEDELERRADYRARLAGAT